MKRVLFVCKNRVSTYGISYGLHNSAAFVAQALDRSGIEAKVVSVGDNNDIDRVVTEYDPTHVVIEAIWVVPSKIQELIKMRSHRRRGWVVRLHSRVPFLAMEGIAIDWLREYKKIASGPGHFRVAANHLQTCDDIAKVLETNCLYQPNIYPIAQRPRWDRVREVVTERRHRRDVLDIGCFGAIRPLKNTLIQAFAAIEFADRMGMPLRFHINGGRTEQQGEQNLKNLRALFPIRDHELVEHPWIPHREFVDLVRAMDMGLQVSFSETFNIVAADFVSQDIPIVASPEIEFVSSLFQAHPTNTLDIVSKLERAWTGRSLSLQSLNRRLLGRHNLDAMQAWLDSLEIASR
jgi:hypothetical protein